MAKLIGLYADSTAFAAYLIESINGEIVILNEVFSINSSIQNILEKLQEFKGETKIIKCNKLSSLMLKLRQNKWTIRPIELDVFDSEYILNSDGIDGRIKCRNSDINDNLLNAINDNLEVNHKLLALFNALHQIDKPKFMSLFSTASQAEGDFGRYID